MMTEQEKKKKELEALKVHENSQILIEDATLAAFGFDNPAEVKIKK